MEDGLGNCEVTHREGQESEKPKTRPVREILREIQEEDLEKRRRYYSDLNFLLPAINTEAVANEYQEQWIKNACNVFMGGSFSSNLLGFLSVINSFRG